MISEILKKYHIKAKKSLGQNFLIDENILDTIASTLDLEGKNILEVGSGYGALTEKLLELKPKSLHLVELDKEMIEVLEKRKENGELNTAGIDFQIFNKDVLKFEPEFKVSELDTIQGRFPSAREGQKLPTTHYPLPTDYFVVANIPYYITSPILYRFLYDLENKPLKMLILMQKDVGDKILQGQNNVNKKNKSSVLSLFIAKKSYVKEIVKVPAKSFVPAPKVESSVLLFELHNNYKEIDDTKFLDFIKIGFQEPRKKLINNLVKGGFNKEKVLTIIEKIGFNENARGEELNIDDWIEVYKQCL